MTTTIEGTTVETVSVFTVPVSVLRDLSSAAVAASTDKYAHVLGVVRLEFHGTGMRAVATDRYRLAIIDYWHRDGDWAYDGFAESMVPAKELTAYVKTLPKAPKRGHEPVVVIRPEDGQVSFTCVTPDGEVSRTIRCVEGEFPNYRGIMPDTFTGLDGDGIRMNPAYMADVDKLPCVNAQVGVHMQCNGPTKALVWSHGDEETDRISWQYLLMPIRKAG